MAKTTKQATNPKSKTTAAKKRTTSATKRRTATAKKPTHKLREAHTKDFMVVQFTRDSLYWLIFGVIAIIFALWVTSLQQRVNELYDQVYSMNASNNVLNQQQSYYRNHPEKTASKTD